MKLFAIFKKNWSGGEPEKAEKYYSIVLKILKSATILLIYYILEKNIRTFCRNNKGIDYVAEKNVRYNNIRY